MPSVLAFDSMLSDTLSDIIDRYKLEAKNFTSDVTSDKINLKIFTKDLEEDRIMTDKAISEKEISDRINAEVDKKLATFQATLEKTKEENESLKTSFTKYKEDSEKKITTLESQKNEAELDKYTLDLKSKNLISPSMEPYIKALASSSSKQEFTIGDKKFSAQQTIEELLKLAKSVYSINRDEKTLNIEPEKTDTQKDLEKQIKEYMTSNKVEYSVAYREIMKTASK